MRKLLQLQRPAIAIGAVGAAAGVVITSLQFMLNLLGFDGTKPTGSVIKDLRAEVRSNKVVDDVRDSATQRTLIELKQLVKDNRDATDNNTAILCFQLKSPLPLCNEVLRTRGLK